MQLVEPSMVGGMLAGEPQILREKANNTQDPREAVKVRKQCGSGCLENATTCDQ